jgi:hypothetical protein
MQHVKTPTGIFCPSDNADRKVCMSLEGKLIPPGRVIPMGTEFVVDEKSEEFRLWSAKRVLMADKSYSPAIVNVERAKVIAAADDDDDEARPRTKRR